MKSNRIQIFILFIIIISCNSKNYSDSISCNCESNDNLNFIGIGKSIRFSNKKFANLSCSSDLKAKSGKYSVMLTNECPYGMTYTIKQSHTKEYFRVKVWRHLSNHNGVLAVSADNLDGLYLVQNKSNNIIDGDWEQLSFDFIIPESANGKNIKIFTWNAGDSVPIFFDDLSIEYLGYTASSLKYEKSFFIDNRDGQRYEIVKYGNKWWMTENLKFSLNDSCLCYDNNVKYCETFGRLYNFKSAKEACPKGWRLASDNDWKELEQLIGMTPIEIEKYGDRGLDESIKLRENSSTGFNVKLAGAFVHGGFYNLNRTSYFWTSTEIDKNNAYCREISQRVDIGRFKDEKSMHFSVRCVKNE